MRFYLVCYLLRLLHFDEAFMVEWDKNFKTTTVYTDIRLFSGGEAPYLATIVNEQHNIVFK